MTIHPSAIIEDGAKIGVDVSIGPFCVVGPKVVLGDRVTLKSHVVVTGDTTVGADTIIFPFCCIGEIPQDVKFQGEAAQLVIGQRNRIREHVTMNPGTQGGGGITSVGDDGFFLAGCHVAHDARIGDRVIIVNQSAVAGIVSLKMTLSSAVCAAFISLCASVAARSLVPCLWLQTTSSHTVWFRARVVNSTG